MTEQLKNHESSEANGENPWTKIMSSLPRFEDRQAEKDSESEKNSINLESLQSVEGFSEQLESLGANPDIISNPAFMRVLDKLISNSGLQTGANLKESKVSADTLNFQCNRGRIGGSDTHDCSKFRLAVEENGNFTIEYAYADRGEVSLSRTGAPWENDAPHLGEHLKGYEDKNYAARYSFVKQTEADGFNIDIVDVYEYQETPEINIRDVAGAALYNKSIGKKTRRFNADGQETSYESRLYSSTPVKTNTLAPKIGSSNRFGRPSAETATFGALDALHDNNLQEPTRTESYRRVSDHTITQRIWDAKTGVTEEEKYISDPYDIMQR